jgi:N-acetylmuramic acid 6-phosphate etherase
MSLLPPSQNKITLGLEGGATRTTVLMLDQNDQALANFTVGPANLRRTNPEDLEAHFRGIQERLPHLPNNIGVGLAGVRLPSDHERLSLAIERVWPNIPSATSDDLITALEAVDWNPSCPAQVLVLSGTGSCCFGRHRNGSRTRLGGRGHLLGDQASATDIAQRALRILVNAYDTDPNHTWPSLGADLLSHLQMNEPADLVDWSLDVPKNELASLAVPIFEAARLRQDPVATAVLNQAAETLARDAIACAEHLATDREQVQFIFNGAVLLKNPDFQEQVKDLIRQGWRNSDISALERPSVWGAIALARTASGSNSSQDTNPTYSPSPPTDTGESFRPVSTAPTEQRNPKSSHFSELNIREGLELMLTEDANIPAAILPESSAIEWTIKRVIQSFTNGGRLIYCGAGTSGRLGVLDASECPPTFRSSPRMVQGIIAGGRSALWSAVEGAEDDPSEGAAAIVARDIGENDVVVGISASGHAPFIWGCLAEAKKRKAATVLICVNPAYKEHPLPDQVIAPNTGPELLTGSTRLRAGTATKLVLNAITTLAMTHSGKVTGNLMTDLNPSNVKLRQRAVSIVQELTKATEEEATSALKNSSWNVSQAIAEISAKERSPDLT